MAMGKPDIPVQDMAYLAYSAAELGEVDTVRRRDRACLVDTVPRRESLLVPLVPLVPLVLAPVEARPPAIVAIDRSHWRAPSSAR